MKASSSGLAGDETVKEGVWDCGQYLIINYIYNVLFSRVSCLKPKQLFKLVNNHLLMYTVRIDVVTSMLSF